ncbi:MAG: YfbM family protein [Pseudomonadota bacterium]
MGMCLALHSVSDENVKKILVRPELIWRLIASDDPDIYEETVKEMNQVGFLAKLFGKKAPTDIEVPDLNFIEGENVDDDLDKSWQGIHYCLNKTAYEAAAPMDFITVGGETADSIDVGYGPARLFNSETVKEIQSRLSNISTGDIAANYNPEEMDKLDIYPNIWSRDGDEGLEYITEYYETLKNFISDCTSNNLGMAVYIC